MEQLIKKDEDAGMTQLVKDSNASKLKVTKIFSQLELPLGETESAIEMEVCPECGIESVIRTGRCLSCVTCGWSACSV